MSDKKLEIGVGTGTLLIDKQGLKIYELAQKEGMPYDEFCIEIVIAFSNLAATILDKYPPGEVREHVAAYVDRTVTVSFSQELNTHPDKSMMN